ncbi:putative phage tail protein [Burkholderia sp. IDO3]|uniref:YmfQ family protein n=1 Tax=Burkholderia sp. IDO3 TaxID=1705310 RepID=UPI000BBAF025|nr:putative phage tail protein [Burkholderia sp. IDO3]AXK61547.1 DUF2313 domain-containing protein [Burkholderia sp. IDO3]PCD58158.1 phage tail protein [Burkholderia sp. IDO3]
MFAPNFTAADFLRALQGLMPRGRIWPRASDAVQTKVLGGIAPSYERQTARANYLLVDAFPATTLELLPEWESSLGLPDACAGPSPTISARRNQVVARFINQGGQSVAFFYEQLSALGYPAIIEQYQPFRMGQSSMTGSLGSQDWAHTWAVWVPIESVSQFRMGESYMGEPLQSWGNAVLECELNSMKPAQTILQFRYSVDLYDLLGPYGAAYLDNVVNVQLPDSLSNG